MNAYRDQYATLFKDGRGVVLIAISADPDTALASWARDSEYPVPVRERQRAAVGRQYGALASEPGTDQPQPVRGGAGRQDRLPGDPVPGSRPEGLQGSGGGDRKDRRTGGEAVGRRIGELTTNVWTRWRQGDQSFTSIDRWFAGWRPRKG